MHCQLLSAPSTAMMCQDSPIVTESRKQANACRTAWAGPKRVDLNYADQKWSDLSTQRLAVDCRPTLRANSMTIREYHAV